ncbi:Uncharacterised protein [Actinomadura madurae]|nr:Uncharacterised protein [Actinomadura madurae]
MGFVDHGPGEPGEPVAGLLRPGNAGSNTAANHITAAKLALTRLPTWYRHGRKTLIRTDTAGGTHEFVGWLSARDRRLACSVGMTVTGQIHAAFLQIPASAWTPAIEPGGRVRDGAWVAELGSRVLAGGPAGMRLIARKERPHPEPRLHRHCRDAPDLLCHQHQDHAAHSTGLRNLPLHDTAQNQIWLEIVQIALELLLWMPPGQAATRPNQRRERSRLVSWTE